MNYTYLQLMGLLERELQLQLKLAATTNTGLHVPLILGPVGIGKTRLIHDVGESLGFERHQRLVLSGGDVSDSTEIAGMLVPSRTKVVGDVPVLSWGMSDVIAEICERPCMLIIDDVDKAPDAIQGALLGLVSTRTIRGYPVHCETVMVAAGNRPEDDVLSRSLSESLLTRLTPMELRVDLPSWVLWARTSGVVPEELIGFISSYPNLLHGKTGARSARFPTPRGWEEVALDMREYPDPFEDVLGDGTNNNWKTIVSLRCGEEVSNTFWAWFTQLRNIDVARILKIGDGVADAGIQKYVACYAIVQELIRHPLRKKGSAPGLVKFIEGLTPEMRTALLVQCPVPVQKNLGDMQPDALGLLGKAVSL